MSRWLQEIKPAASARIHLFTAAVAWTLVGSLLVFFGLMWIAAGQSSHLLIIVIFAAAIGLLKSRFMLDRTATRIVDRIKRRGDGRCIGGFLSPRSWLLLGAMVGCGRLLRASALPHPVIGFLYTAIGTAILLSARAFWLAWQRHEGPSPS